MGTPVVNLLWSGGWESTYRLLDLVLLKRRAVQPYYVIDPWRLSTAIELRTRAEIRQLMVERHPHTRELVLATKYSQRDEIRPNTRISESFRQVFARTPIGYQYDWLAQFAEESGLTDLELGIQKGGTIDRALHGMLERVPAEDPYFRVKREAIGSAEYDVFGRYRFPIFDLSKADVGARAAAQGFGDLMERTWFCRRPNRRGQPCGTCWPCQYAMRQGMSHRIPVSGRLRYRLARIAPRWVVRVLRHGGGRPGHSGAAPR